MKRFSLRLRKILLLDIIYYLLLIISILFIIIYNKKYIPLNKYDLNDNNFILKIKTIKIDGNKLSLEFYDEIVGTYYFKTKVSDNVGNSSISSATASYKVYALGTTLQK